MKKLLAVLLCLGLTGCATNWYSRYYYDNTKGVDVFKAGLVIMPTTTPEIIYGGDNKEEDAMKLAEDNYALLGYSSFWAARATDEQAMEVGKEIHAEKILLYKKYRDTNSGVMPMTLPNIQTSTTNGIIGSTFVSAQTTTYGTQTMDIPYSVDRYDYYATYWVKRKNLPILGVYYKDLTDDMRKQIGSNKGVVVTGVIKNSPAFNEDLFKNDIIEKIDDAEVVDKNMFKDLLDKVGGKKVTITFLRDGKELTKTIQMNQKPNAP